MLNLGALQSSVVAWLWIMDFKKKKKPIKAEVETRTLCIGICNSIQLLIFKNLEQGFSAGQYTE